MGNNYSSVYMKQYVNEQIQKVKKNEQRKFINIKEVFAFEPPNKIPLKTQNLGILFVMDSDKTGKFDEQKIFDFWQKCNKISKKFQTYEIHFRIQSYCSEKFAKQIVTQKKQEEVTEWIIECLKNSYTEEKHVRYPNVEYYQFEFIEPMYQLFDVQILKQITLQELFYFMQQAAEEKNLLDINCTKLDNFIPLQIIREFIQNFLKGICEVYQELFKENLRQDSLQINRDYQS